MLPVPFAPLSTPVYFDSFRLGPRQCIFVRVLSPSGDAVKTGTQPAPGVLPAQHNGGTPLPEDPASAAAPPQTCPPACTARRLPHPSPHLRRHRRCRCPFLLVWCPAPLNALAGGGSQLCLYGRRNRILPPSLRHPGICVVSGAETKIKIEKSGFRGRECWLQVGLRSKGLNDGVSAREEPFFR